VGAEAREPYRERPAVGLLASHRLEGVLLRLISFHISFRFLSYFSSRFFSYTLIRPHAQSSAFAYASTGPWKPAPLSSDALKVQVVDATTSGLPSEPLRSTYVRCTFSPSLAQINAATPLNLTYGDGTRTREFAGLFIFYYYYPRSVAWFAFIYFC
jgi:hypothetical protein